MSIKNPNDTFGNRTYNLPACSALPQPAASARASKRGDKKVQTKAEKPFAPMKDAYANTVLNVLLICYFEHF